jgi:hypothetical protein
MAKIGAQKLEELIKKHLDEFYSRRTAKLTSLNLTEALTKKNPYLFRARGVQQASEIVAELLQAYISSSDESIFGDAFFEPIAKAVSGGQTGGGEGIDMIKETDVTVTAYAVKSGPHWGNADQWNRQRQNFQSLQNRLRKLHKAFDPVLGYGYGRRNTDPKGSKNYRQRSGQAFWEELTDDSDFYLKLIRLMKHYPQEHRVRYQVEWKRAVNRFEREFLNNFSTPDGDIDWEKLVEFNSGKQKRKLRESKPVIAKRS